MQFNRMFDGSLYCKGTTCVLMSSQLGSHALCSPVPAAQCKAVITCNQGLRGGRTIDLKGTVDKAVKSCPSVRCVFVSQRTDKAVAMGELDIFLEEVVHTGDLNT